MFNKKILMCLIVAAMLMTVSCAPMGGDELVLPMPGGTAYKFITVSLLLLLRTATVMKPGSCPVPPAMTFTSLREGSIDIYMETWQGNLKTAMMKGLKAAISLSCPLITMIPGKWYYVPTFVIEGDPERGIEPMAPDLRRVDSAS